MVLKRALRPNLLDMTPRVALNATAFEHEGYVSHRRIWR
jgi:hypothetical protein